MGGLYCFGGGAARSVTTSQFEFGIFHRVASRVESTPGTRILPATQATYLTVFYSPKLYGDMSIFYTTLFHMSNFKMNNDRNNHHHHQQQQQHAGDELPMGYKPGEKGGGENHEIQPAPLGIEAEIPRI